MPDLRNIQRVEDLSPLMRGLIAGKKLHHVQGTVSEVLSKGALAYAIHQYICEWKVLPLEDNYTIPRMVLFLSWKEGDTFRDQSDIIEIRKSNNSLNDLARKYNVTKGCINNIIKRKTWKYYGI